MPSLKDLKNKIASVKNTRKITKAMQMVSAAKLRRAQASGRDGQRQSAASGGDDLGTRSVRRLQLDHRAACPRQGERADRIRQDGENPDCRQKRPRTTASGFRGEYGGSR